MNTKYSRCHQPRVIGPTGLLAVIAVVSGPVSAQVISGTQITFESVTPPPWGGQYSALVYQTAAGNFTDAWFDYAGTTLAVTGELTDEGSDWYLAKAGDVLSAATIAAGHLPLLYSAATYEQPQPPVTIPLGDFYLGTSTGVGFASGYPNRDAFGWLELNNDGHTLTPIANAVDYGDGGIIVGTTTAIPEPASLLVLAGGWAMLAQGRRMLQTR